MQLSLSQTPKSISSANYLLRQYGGAAAAYSLQRLDTSTTNVVRARRSTDDAESNFTAEEVSGGTLREFTLNNDADLIRFANQATAADKRMYFDGVNDRVDTGYKADMTSDFFVEAKFVLTKTGANQTIFCDAATERGVQLFVTAGNVLQANVLNSSGIQVVATGATTLSAGVIYTARLTHDVSETSLTIYLDTVQDATGTYAGTWNPVNHTNISIGDFPAGGVPFNGIIYDINFNDTSAFNGYGNTNADWEDQVGSNDGTVNGSPALFSGQGFDAYVTTLYDQSGNGRNATQATAASQPQIVADGVVVTDGNGNVSMDFDGTDDYLTLSSGSLSIAQPNTSFCVFELDDPAAVRTVYDSSNLSGRNGVYTATSQYRMFAGSNLSGGSTDTHLHLSTALFNTTSSDHRIDGTSVASGNPGTQSLDGINIGANPTPASYGDGRVSELIVYPTDQSSNRAAIERSMAGRYGITI